MHLIITSIDGSTETHSDISRDRARQVAAAATRHPRTLEVLVFAYAPAWGLIPLAESDAIVAAWKQGEGWLTPDTKQETTMQDTTTSKQATHDLAVEAIEAIEERIARGEEITADDVMQLDEAIASAANTTEDLDALFGVIKYAARMLDSIKLHRHMGGDVEDAIYEAQLGLKLDDLPTFGGVDAYGDGIWSWDAERLLVGDGGFADWCIVSREDGEVTERITSL